MSDPLHELLSKALCVAVEFGDPVKIRIGKHDFRRLLIGANPICPNGLPDEFEGVAIQIEPLPFRGCLVVHDDRHRGNHIMVTSDPHPIPASVALMRDTREHAIVVWENVE